MNIIFKSQNLNRVFVTNLYVHEKNRNFKFVTFKIQMYVNENGTKNCVVTSEMFEFYILW